MFTAATAQAAHTPAVLGASASAVLDQLTETLREDPPEASQGAEAAFTLLLMSLADQKVLNLVDEGEGDLNATKRLSGDRALGDWLCREVLSPRNIPATKGPLQSSSFRAGYLSPQVRRSDLKRYVDWQSAPERSFEEITAFAEHLTLRFLAASTEIRPFPRLATQAFTFWKFRLAREKLFSRGSGGAFEQYLVAGLMEQELQQSGSRNRVETKSVGANDDAAGSAGDVEVRSGQALVSAIEVSAADWRSKLGQLEAAARSGVRSATIVARGVTSASGQTVADAIALAENQSGVDVAVLELDLYLDVLASRVNPFGRAAAFEFVHTCLRRYHRRQPELAERLVRVLVDVDLVLDDEEPIVLMTPSPSTATLERLRDSLRASELVDDPLIVPALTALASELRRE